MLPPWMHGKVHSELSLGLHSPSRFHFKILPHEVRNFLSVPHLSNSSMHTTVDILLNSVRSKCMPLHILPYWYIWIEKYLEIMCVEHEENRVWRKVNPLPSKMAVFSMEISWSSKRKVSPLPSKMAVFSIEISWSSKRSPTTSWRLATSLIELSQCHTKKRYLLQSILKDTT